MKPALRCCLLVLLALWAVIVTAADEKLAVRLPPDLALMPANTAAFVCVQPGTLVRHPLAKAVAALDGEGERIALEKDILLGLAPADIERATVVFPNLAEAAVIVQARKPYDREALLKAVGKDVREERLVGRTLHLARGKAVWLVNPQCFVVGVDGGIAGIEALDPANSGPERLGGAARIAAAGKHLVVLAADIGEVMPAVSALSGLDEDLHDADKRKPGKRPTRDAIVARLPLELLPYKPLMLARDVVLAIRAGEDLDVELTFQLADADQAIEGETSMRTARYVLREGLPRMFRQGAWKSRYTDLGAQFSKASHAALAGARITRDGSSVRITGELQVDVATLPKLVQAIKVNQLERVSVNNLKQIGLAMHNLHDTMGKLPGQAIVDRDGKPLLSWRVTLLPYMDQDALYRQFKLDEPWDSPHNKKLLAKMPAVYKHPVARSKDGHSTYYQVFTGPNTPFPAGKRDGPRMADFTDGTSNTVLVAEAATAVPWSKPEDLTLKEDKPLPELGGHFKGAVHGLFMDGSVKALRADLEEKVWRMLIDPGDGMVLPNNLEVK